jgi:spore germination protein GerM
MKRIAVFFVTSDGNALTTTEREIPGEVTLIEQLKMTIQILTSKPPEGLITPLPEGTRLLSLFTDSLGNAYLDFSREIQQNHIRGLTAELLTVSSIVNTLLFNFKDLKGVQLLVEGSEIETLAGHIDCTKPFSQLLVIENRT